VWIRFGVPSLDRHLALGIGPEELDFPLLAQARVIFHQTMCQVDRQRHQRLGFLAREAEHHALIAGAADINAHRDVG
jgi:hypothetical protein